ncbi:MULTISPECIES: phage tail tape measure protein [Ruegeria]|uniref:Phage tail tape measure protein n=1 Tax=Ruegeria atlantica TaxID=81569 RepID=A0ABX1W5I4_9RHOB|nr:MULTISPECIES: phage tail tape measure protein [Ruegeria]NOD29176.1 phage tail tape measure protein [Ruegeria atlantica]NOD83053.1 phage tail tape measure protein [Ruegeria sp. HKCCD6119]UUV04858.1 phage tail tape measure protein [Ruegeria sp. YS9]
MTDRDGFDDLQERGEALGDSLGDAATMAAAFDSQMKRISAAFEETGKDVATLERGMSSGLRKAFDGVVLDGMSLSGALDVLKNSLIQTAYAAAIKPVTDHFGGMLANTVGGLVKGILPFADGGSFSQGRVMPFANGGVVSGPTTFPMRGGTGLMGEAGPEAIMPLARGADGKLGVRTQGAGRAVNVVMNISTPDVQGFRRSQGQIAAQMSRALGRGNRNR